MAKIAVMGHGVVGSGVVEVIDTNRAQIAKRAGEEIEVKRVLDLREFPGLSYTDKFTKEFQDIVSDGEISVVCETMGGLHPAYEFTRSLLESGKSVITSNKELVAQKGAELLRVAKEHNVNYLFEASVGGGIPIIRPLHRCLAGNSIEEIVGILNGTTNFILTKMVDEGMKFDEALALAQKLGYAEKDPTADIEGGDACRKICILASLAYGTHIYPENVHTSGISKLTLEDVAYARSWGGEIKLIGRAKPVGEDVAMMVCPMFVPNESMLSSVHDVFNGILVKGNAVDKVAFIGRGAGKLPTASAVVGDVVAAVKAKETSISQTWEPADRNVVTDYHRDTNSFYIRLTADDTAAAKQFIEESFTGVQYLSRDGQPENELAFTTGHMVEDDVRGLLDKMKQRKFKVLAKIRILELI